MLLTVDWTHHIHINNALSTQNALNVYKEDYLNGNLECGSYYLSIYTMDHESLIYYVFDVFIIFLLLIVIGL